MEEKPCIDPEMVVRCTDMGRRQINLIEDQLTRDERIRLESLAQANNTHTLSHDSASQVLMTAKVYESYIRGNKNDQS